MYACVCLLMPFDSAMCVYVCVCVCVSFKARMCVYILCRRQAIVVSAPGIVPSEPGVLLTYR